MGLFKKLEKNRVLHVIIFLVLEVIVLGVYFIGGKWAEKESKKAYIRELEEEFDQELLVDINGIHDVGDELEISGWTLRYISKNLEVNVVLCATDDSEIHVLDAKLVDEKDVLELYQPTWDPGKCGIVSRIDKDKLNEDICYEIQLFVSYEKTKADGEKLVTIQEEKKVETDAYLYNGELFSVNPLEYAKPEVKDEELVKVVNAGEPLAYDEDKRIWIYEYDSALYWMIDSKSPSLLEERLEILLFLYSFEAEDSQEEGGRTKFSRIERQIVEADYTQLRDGLLVYSHKIPNEYPVTYMVTGIYQSYGKGWIWRTNILYDILSGKWMR